MYWDSNFWRGIRFSGLDEVTSDAEVFRNEIPSTNNPTEIYFTSSVDSDPETIENGEVWAIINETEILT